MIKTILFSYFTIVQSQLMVPGSQRDEHNCILDGGYSWCESAQQCQRPWEQSCHEKVKEVDYCEQSNIQTCHMACDEPKCPVEECAMRIRNCCDYTCVARSIDETVHECPDECPQPAPCPMPMINVNCHYVQPVIDHCGCVSGCGSIDCSSIPVSGEGGTCRSYMMEGMIHHCLSGLECVNTMGPMIADAPGTCQPICETSRDDWGNCIESGCNSWFDGCNTCDLIDESCTEKVCHERKESRCLESDSENNDIPSNCLTWYDGCNTCTVNNGEIQGCTMMYCFTINEPYCQTFTRNQLIIGDICYRFCEDGSQNSIDRQNDCPSGSECLSDNPSMISFDSCGSRAKRCIPSNGH